MNRDKYIVLSGLAGISVLAWLYILSLGWSTVGAGMGAGMGAQEQAWDGMDFALAFVMWAVMMVALMVPSSTPMILMFARVNRERRKRQATFVPTGIFVLSYIVVWSGFSVLAALAQWQLHAASLLSPAAMVTSPVLGGMLLIAAGVFQWTPLKQACLTHCRSPLSHLMTGWREGRLGAFVMGLRHGGYCVGCCWLLMALLFVAGVMNLLWTATIGAFVLIEKVTPGDRWISRTAGLLLCTWGVLTAVGALPLT
ncbi:MAG: DUF2182 domain-containing protein [Dehalococcoidia bacterium]|nr:DUF2182 domain-containing protein [Dehalococcoidia bacterium]